MQKVCAQMNGVWGGMNKIVKNTAKAENERLGQYDANV